MPRRQRPADGSSNRPRGGRPAAARGGAQPSRVRIVGGRWRGSRVAVAPGGSIRPTPDRVRETLFNWLAPRIAGMRCLDLFAGSGVLGLEAVSRGAAEAVFVERDPAAAHLLRAAIERLDCTVCRLVRGDARAYLAGEPTAFDLVFLDPPFGSGLLEASAARVVEGGWLADRGLLYLETAREAAWPTLPGLVPWREGAAGQVRYGLFAGARAD